MKLRKSFPEGIRNIIFDLGNVVVDLDVSATLRSFAKLHITGLHPEDIHPHQKGFFLDYELGKIDDQGFLRALRDCYDCSGISDQQIWNAWNAMLKDPETSRFETIRQLGYNYRLFVLSNTNEQHIRRFYQLYEKNYPGQNFETLFEKCFYSHRMGMRKPDEGIYRQVITETSIIPEETLFIDDNSCNFSGAETLKINTYHLTGGESLPELFE